MIELRDEKSPSKARPSSTLSKGKIEMSLRYEIKLSVRFLYPLTDGKLFLGVLFISELMSLAARRTLGIFGKEWAAGISLTEERAVPPVFKL